MIKNLSIIGAGFLIVVLGLVIYSLWETILMLGEMLVYFVVGGLIILAGMGLLFVYNLVADVFSKNQHEAKLRALELEARQVEIDHDNITIVKAKVDEQILIGSTRQSKILFQPGHLGGAVNGQNIEPTLMQLKMWDRWQQLHSTAKPQPQIRTEKPPAQLEPGQPLQPILERLKASHQILIAGATGSGKTTLCKHLITWLAGQGYRVIPCDIHSPSKMLNFDVVGSGRKFGDVFNALEMAVEIMNERYNHPDYGKPNYQPEPIAIFLDELTSVVKVAADEKSNFVDNLQCLLTEGRKVGIKLILSIHSLDVKTLGLTAGVRESNTMVRLLGGDGSAYRCFIVPAMASIRSTKDWIAHTLPGEFVGYPASDGVTTKLPSAQELKAVRLSSQGFTVTSIAREVFSVKKPNSTHISEIRAILANAE